MTAAINLKPKQLRQNCPNCHVSNHIDVNYCPQCGQKSGLGLHSVWQMVLQFFANTFNVESKLTQSALGLFKPGFLTQEYLALHRVSYLSPIRIFVVLMFLWFLLLSFVGVDSLLANVKISNGSSSNEKEQQFDRDFLLQAISVDNYINQQLTDLNVLITQRNQPQEVVDKAKQSITALREILALNLDKPFLITLLGGRYELLERDIYQLDSDKIFEKYNINSRIDRLIVRAMLRFTQDPSGFNKFLFGNMTWAFFLDVLLMAGLFKLFYPKTKYTVHFVYHLHLRSFIFLCIMLGMGLYWLLTNGWYIAVFLILLVFIYIAISLQRVYPRHFLKTTIYFIIFIPLAFISFLTSTLVVMFFSSILF